MADITRLTAQVTGRHRRHHLLLLRVHNRSHLTPVASLTAQHYFGIVPLHQNQQHQLAYLQTCAALLSSVGLEARHSDPASPGAAGGPSSSFGGPPAPAPAPSPLSAGGSVAVEEPAAERSRRHSAPSVAPQLDNV